MMNLELMIYLFKFYKVFSTGIARKQGRTQDFCMGGGEGLQSQNFFPSLFGFLLTFIKIQSCVISVCNNFL